MPAPAPSAALRRFRRDNMGLFSLMRHGRRLS
jgi:hypothetical protein